MHDLFVGAFTVPAHAITATGFTLARGQKQHIEVIFHVQPILHIQQISLQQDRFAAGRFHCDHGNQLFRELPGAVIV